MIILFSFSLGVMTARYKKRQITYIDTLIYIAQKISIMLNSITAETQQIMNELKSDEKLKNFDFELSDEKSPLNASENEKVRQMFLSIGKYDLDSQLKLIEEFTGNFKMLKEEYQSHYDSHRKLYIASGLLSGVLIAVLLA